MAGIVGGGPDVPDLIAAAAAAATSAGSADMVGAALRQLFTRVAPAVRAAPAAASAAVVVEPFEVPVLTVALLAGPTADGVLLEAVGLTAEGQCVLATRTGQGVAYGPSENRAQLNLAVSEAADRDGVAAAEHMREAIAAAVVRHHALVSLDCDLVVVGPDGAGPVTSYRHPGGVVPRGV